MRNKNLILTGILLSSLLANFAAGAENPLFPPDSCGQLIGKLTVSAAPQDIAVSGSYAYLSGDELKVVDISNPASPALKGSFNPGRRPGGDPLGVQSVAVSGRYVLAGTWYQGQFRSISVASPASPRLVKVINLGGVNSGRFGQTQIAISNNYAYVAGDSDVKVVNVSNPANPLAAGNLPANPNTQISGWVYASGKYAYAGGEPKIFDVSNPASPVLKGKLSPSGGQVVYSSGNYIYYSHSSGLMVLDVSDPGSPKVVKAADKTLQAGPLKQKGPLLYGATGNGFKIIDATDVTKPKLLKEVVLTQGKTQALALQGNYVYLANSGSADNLMVAKITDCQPVPKPSPAVYLGDRRLAGPISIVSCGQTYTFKIDNYSHSQVWLVQTKNNLPTYDKAFTVPNTHQSACFRDEGSYTNKFYTLAAGQRGDFLGEVGVEIRRPGNAPVVSFYSGGGKITQAQCGDAYTLKVDNYPYSRLWVEQTKTRNGVEVGKSEGILSNPYTYTSFCSRDNDPEGDVGHFVTTVFSAINDQKGPVLLGTVPFDVTHRGPTSCGTVATKYTTGGAAAQIAVEGTKLYVTNLSGLQILDISDPRKPKLAGRYQQVGVEGLLVYGKYAYLGTPNEVVAVDVSNPASPGAAGSIAVPAGGGANIALAATGNTLYVGGGPAVNILNIANPEEPAKIATQNVFTTFQDLKAAGQYLFATGNPDGFKTLSAQTGAEAAKLAETSAGGALYVAGNYAYTSAKFSVIDIANPRAPKLLKQDDALSGRAIFGSGNLLYVIGSDLKTIDITRPASPRLIHTTALPNGQGVAVRVIGDTAYVATRTAAGRAAANDVALIDLSDCTNPDEGPGPGTAELKIDGITPDPLYIDEDNEIFLSGTGFGPDAVISVDDSKLQILNFIVNDNGAGIQAQVRVTTRAAAQDRPIFTVTSGQALGGAGSSASRKVGLAVRAQDAPKITDISAGEGALTVTGSNFANITAVQIVGLPNVVVDDFQIVSDTQLRVSVTVLDFNPNVFGFLLRFIKPARAAGNQGLLLLEAPAGEATAAFDQNLLNRLQGSAQPPVEPPKTGFGKICSVGETGIAQCIKNLYLLALGLGALLALLMMILSGYRYLTAQGNATQVENAKEAFTAAIIGVVVIFIAFILLNVINPDLVRFKPFEF